MGSSKGSGLWLHCDSSVVSPGNIILLMFSVANLPDLSIRFSFSRHPFASASRSRLHWPAKETDRKTIGYPGCQCDYDHDCSSLFLNGWVYGFSGLLVESVR